MCVCVGGGGGKQLLRLLPETGLLLQLESLLSTAGNEIGMLEDLVIAFHLLAKVVLVIRDADLDPHETHGDDLSDTDSGEDEDDPRYHMLVTLRKLNRLRVFSGTQYEARRGAVRFAGNHAKRFHRSTRDRSGTSAGSAGSGGFSGRDTLNRDSSPPDRNPTPSFVIEITLPHRLFASLPKLLQECVVPVVPVMFTQVRG